MAGGFFPALVLVPRKPKSDSRRHIVVFHAWRTSLSRFWDRSICTTARLDSPVWMYHKLPNSSWTFQLFGKLWALTCTGFLSWDGLGPYSFLLRQTNWSISCLCCRGLFWPLRVNSETGSWCSQSTQVRYSDGLGKTLQHNVWVPNPFFPPVLFSPKQTHIFQKVLSYQANRYQEKLSVRGG